jgi:NAD(P)-dependent dehydrogenase (short-subunit alcohol dehydrogenase family)
LQVSSIGGVAAFPSLGIYHASKWALEGITEALSAEVAMFGIRTTLIEPGGYATDWAGASARRSEPLPAYQPIRDAMMAASAGTGMPGPGATARAILALVDADEPPPRLLLGSFAHHTALEVYGRRLAVWNGWESVARGADSP